MSEQEPDHRSETKVFDNPLRCFLCDDARLMDRKTKCARPHQSAMTARIIDMFSKLSGCGQCQRDGVVNGKSLVRRVTLSSSRMAGRGAARWISRFELRSRRCSRDDPPRPSELMNSRSCRSRTSRLVSGVDECDEPIARAAAVHADRAGHPDDLVRSLRRINSMSNGWWFGTSATLLDELDLVALLVVPDVVEIGFHRA